MVINSMEISTGSARWTRFDGEKLGRLGPILTALPTS